MQGSIRLDAIQRKARVPRKPAQRVTPPASHVDDTGTRRNARRQHPRHILWAAGVQGKHGPSKLRSLPQLPPNAAPADVTDISATESITPFGMGRSLSSGYCPMGDRYLAQKGFSAPS
jgi:hypothetical protein